MFARITTERSCDDSNSSYDAQNVPIHQWYHADRGVRNGPRKRSGLHDPTFVPNRYSP